jgi:membrane fusion protein, multidrug efflux system
MIRSGWIVAAIAVAAACGGGSEAAPAGSAGAGGVGGAGGRPGGGLATPVETASVTTGRVAREVSVTGIVEPIRSVAVNSQMAGALRTVAVEEGARVGAGAVVARIDDRELAAQVASAEAAHTVARAAYERSNRLRDRQVITMAEYERDRAAFDAAAAQLEQLRTRLDFATIRAPVTGIVTEKRVEAGDAVGAQTHLFTIADVSVLVVRVQVSELDVVQLEQGQPAVVMMDAFPGRRFSGRIRRIFPSADPATRLVPVEVALDTESARVARPGFMARVAFALEPRDGVRLVPASAVTGTGAAQAVFVIEDGRAIRRPVRTGISSAGNVEVLEGLEVGERIVTAGVNTLRDGTAVREVSGAPERAAAPPESVTFQPSRNGGGV